jgi:ketosteroid isomerase-like protein
LFSFSVFSVFSVVVLDSGLHGHLAPGHTVDFSSHVAGLIAYFGSRPAKRLAARARSRPFLIAHDSPVWFVRTMKSLLCAIVFFLAMFIGGRGGQAASRAEEADVLRTDREFYQTTLVKGAEAWVEFAAENVTIDRGPAALHGKDDLLQVYRKAYAEPGFKLGWKPDGASVVGTIGITHGHFELHQVNANGTDQKVTGTYVTVWRRQEDGTWKFVWDGGSEG